VAAGRGGASCEVPREKKSSRSNKGSFTGSRKWKKTSVKGLVQGKVVLSKEPKQMQYSGGQKLRVRPKKKKGG